MAPRSTARRTRGFSGTTARRKRIWAREEHQGSAAGADLVSHDLCQDFCTQWGTKNLPPGTTIGGVKFDFRANLINAAPGLTNGSRLAVGIVVVDTVNLPGGLEVPGPLTDLHADWMYRETFLPATLNASGAPLTTSEFGTLTAGLGTRQVRSQRKMEELGQSLLFVMQNGVAADDFNFAIAASTLLILA